jgi:hypothetical protein
MILCLACEFYEIFKFNEDNMTVSSGELENSANAARRFRRQFRNRHMLRGQSIQGPPQGACQSG